MRNLETDTDFQSLPDALKAQVRADAAATYGQQVPPPKAPPVRSVKPTPRPAPAPTPIRSVPTPRPAASRGPVRAVPTPPLPAFVTSPGLTMDGYPITPPAPQPNPTLQAQFNASQARLIPSNLQPEPSAAEMARNAAAGVGRGVVNGTLFGQLVLKPAERDIIARSPQAASTSHRFDPYAPAHTPEQAALDTVDTGLEIARQLTYGPLVDAYHGAEDLVQSNAITPARPMGFEGSNVGAVRALEETLPEAVGETVGNLLDPTGAAGKALKGLRLRSHARPPAEPAGRLNLKLRAPVGDRPSRPGDLLEAELDPTPAAPAPAKAGGSPLALPPGPQEARLRGAMQKASEAANTLGAEHPETRRLVDEARAIQAEQRQSAQPRPRAGQANTAAPPAVIQAPGAHRPLDYQTDPAALNEREWYHGTGTPGLRPEDLDPNATRIDGLFGHGIYLTDNPDIAGGYANARSKRSKTPTVYRAGVNVGKVLDLEKPMPADALGHFQRAADALGEDVRLAVDEAAKHPDATGETVYRAFSEAVGDGIHNRDFYDGDAAEVMQHLSGDLKQAGYDAYTHIGGKRTGRDPHQVLIMLDPNDHLAGYTKDGKWFGSGEGRDRQIHSFEPVDFQNAPPALPAPKGARRGSVGTGPEPEEVMRQRIDNQIQRLRRDRQAAQERGDGAEVRRLTESIQRLQDAQIITEAPRPTVLPGAATVNSARYHNPSKWHFTSQDVRDRFEARTQEIAARLQAEGRDPKERVPVSEVEAEARRMAPEVVDALKRRRDPKDALNRTEYEAARQTLQELSEEAHGLEQQLNALPANTPNLPEVRQEMLNRLDALDRDIDGFTAAVTMSRSEKGRELAYLRRVTQSGFDVDYWLARAARVSGGALTSQLNRELRTIVLRGHAAQTAGDAAALRLARIDLAKKMATLEKTGTLDTLSALRKAGLLTGIKTIGRNMLSNTSNMVLEEAVRMPAAVIDAGLSLARLTETRGQRSVLMPTVGKLGRGMLKSGTTGVREAVETMFHGIPLDQLAALDLPRENNSGWLTVPGQVPVIGGKSLVDTYINGVFRFQNAQDRLFKAYAMQRSLEDQARLLVREEGRQSGPQQTAAQQEARVRSLVQNPSPDLLREAIADAEFATFQNETAPYKLIAGTRQAADQYGRGVDGGKGVAQRAAGAASKFALDAVVPFAKTPSAIVSRVLQFTPLGTAGTMGMVALGRKSAGRSLVSKLTPAEQKAIAMGISRGAVGSALIYAGARLYDRGVLTPSTDRATMTNDQASNRSPGAAKINGAWVPIASLTSPIGNLLIIGATLQKEGWGAGALAAAAGRSVIDQPMLQGAKEAFDVINPGDEGYGKTANRFAGSYAGSAVPTIVAETAQALDRDHLDREVDPTSPTSAALTSMQKRLPFLRDRLPSKVTALGDEVAVPGGANAYNPVAGKRAIEDTDPVVREVLAQGIDLPRPVRDLPVAPEKGAPRVPATPADIRAVNLIAGKEARQRLKLTLAQPAYHAPEATDTDRQEALKDAISSAHKDGVEAYVSEHTDTLQARSDKAQAEKDAKKAKRRAVVAHK